MTRCPLCGLIYSQPRNRSIFTLYDAVPGAFYWESEPEWLRLRHGR